MFETLTITLREGIEAALVIGIILAYLGKTNKPEMKKYVYAGMIAAIAGSLATAVAIQMLMAEWSEFMEGLMFFIAAFFLATMLFWMHRTSKHIRQDIEQGVESAFSKWQALGVLALTFFMIFREGAEIVLFLSATVKEASPFIALEGAAGLILAVLFGYLFIKGSMKMNLGRFFKITGMMLAVIIFQLIVGGIHEWSEVGIINLSQTGMAIIGPLVKESASIVFTGIMLSFLVLLFVMVPWKHINTEGIEGIEKRKALAAVRKERNRKITTGIVAAFLILAFVSAQISALPQGVDPKPEKISVTGEEVRIPVASAADGDLHKYICDAQNHPADCPMHGSDGRADVRILAIQKTDGGVAVAYDACALCGAAGYVQEGDLLICKRCGAPIDPNTIDLGGGCNPIVLPYIVEGNEIVIKTEDIGEKADLFKN
ncbi:putative membrane protein [Candidatus Methanoperedens nitroreducens]|uniref:Putative membrane protein n=1 Tax=Candidatus Methanoperedens nitratireducens TaxID=1392998 RepID=A0A062V0F2_9EURY|nr:Fe-S-containing protein [Candidatus Methanoperedens nitroreducens]KCZ70857.1 putative membrane protein [Candidatus Methanoperedens nitroreducens]MDJ1420712.1 Fe-S-containing protein [Candidatus Methanoperedens sp.]